LASWTSREKGAMKIKRRAEGRKRTIVHLISFSRIEKKTYRPIETRKRRAERDQTRERARKTSPSLREKREAAKVDIRTNKQLKYPPIQGRRKRRDLKLSQELLALNEAKGEVKHDLLEKKE